MLKVLPVVLLVGAASAVMPELDVVSWQQFKQQYGKVYSDPTEDNNRMKAFAANQVRVAQHMKEYAEGKHSYSMALNKFADLTSEEFVLRFASLEFPGEVGLSIAIHKVSERVKPLEVDWRNSGLVTSVKDQGMTCNSCFAFSAVGALEGAWAKAGRGLQELSAQQLVDCSTSYGNRGCSGGRMHLAYDYIKANGGIDSASGYPYTAMEESCKASGENVANLTGYVSTTVGSEDALLDAVAFVGPVAVGIDSSLPSFQLYSGGVYDDPLCSIYPNSAVLLVGYGKERGLSLYWLVKNSYGTGWGEDGYIKVARNAGNKCGLATYAYYPVV